MFVLLLLACRVRLVEPHARLLEPPSRASMWRLGFPTPRDPDDNQSYCGGFGVQHNLNGGRCGICGDPWNETPREHEAPGGIYANGIITRTYKQGSLIPIVVDITANHQGHFEFKLCPNDNIFLDPEQDCFDHFPLSTSDASKHYPINDRELGFRLLYVQLPLRVTCQQCILQWTYVGGNNWGDCADGTSGLGCGPQENFRSCADVRIVPHPLLADLAITPGELTSSSHLTTASKLLEEKKKLILEAVLKRLKALILLTEEGDNNGRHDGDIDNNALLEKMRSEETERLVFAPDDDVSDYEILERLGQGDDDLRWWEKIISNKH